MVKEIQYTSINRVLDDLLDHPMLSGITLEQVVRHALKFISRHGYSTFYQDKEADVEIHEFRGLLPCDIISIIQVKDMNTHLCLRSMTDSFGMFHKAPKNIKKPVDLMNNVKKPFYIPPLKEYFDELTFKTQGRVIYTSFPEGMVKIAYKAIPVDEDGFPQLIDNETYIDALEAYIKKQMFTVLFDQQKIPAGVLQNAQRDYAVAAALLQSEFTTPSVAEMQSISNFWNTLIPRVREFDNGFKDLGDREYIRNH